MPHERAHFFADWNTGRRLGWLRRLSLLLILALVVSMADVPSPDPAVAAPVAQKPAAKPACPDNRADLVSAAIAAKLCGNRVEALGARTETTQVFANADGTITEDRALAPVRVKNGDKWDDVDLTLIRDADGSVVPRVHARGLKLSGAQHSTGEHEVVSLGSGAQRTSVSWKGELPEPVLDGATATYPEVLPGVDLVVKALTTGYEQFFVAKDRAALRRVAKLTLPMSSGKLTAADDGMGGLAFIDAKGRTVGRAQAPEMWDAKVAPISQEHVNRAPVGLRTVKKSAGKVTVELTADPQFLDRTDLTFPVTIDPPASLPVAFDAFVQNSYSSDQSGADEIETRPRRGGRLVHRPLLLAVRDERHLGCPGHVGEAAVVGVPFVLVHRRVVGSVAHRPGRHVDPMDGAADRAREGRHFDGDEGLQLVVR